MSMIQPVPGSISGMAQASAAMAGVKEAPEIQQSESGGKGHPLKPARDEYVPEEKQEPSGRYWVGKGEDGQPEVYFDDPEKRGPGSKAERCTCSTDQVDREIEKLKKEREELERQLHGQTDDVKAKELEQRLAQVERQLGQKDNDTYRRQHAVFS